MRSGARLDRRALLRLGGATALGGLGLGVLSACGGGSEAPAPAAGTPKPTRHRYGSGAQQLGELTRPATKGAKGSKGSKGSKGTVVVIHGGYWLSQYTYSLGRAISADLADRGWTTWNIEYRRLGDGGGWPTTFADVAAAIDHLAELDVATDDVIALGHSAGGQLAVWAATRDATTPGGAPRVPVTAAVSQAGVLDLVGADQQDLGSGVVPRLLGGSPTAVPDHYRLGDPVQRVPARVPVRCLHSPDDGVVPISQSQSYVARDRAAGGDAELVRVTGDHFAQIDPGTSTWRTAVATLDALVAGPRSQRN